MEQSSETPSPYPANSDGSVNPVQLTTQTENHEAAPNNSYSAPSHKHSAPMPPPSQPSLQGVQSHMTSIREERETSQP